MPALLTMMLHSLPTNSHEEKSWNIKETIIKGPQKRRGTLLAGTIKTVFKKVSNLSSSLVEE